MQRTVTVISELYGGSPKDDTARGILKEKVLADRLIDLAYAGEDSINKVIMFDAWERLPVSTQRAFIDYALPGLLKAEESAKRRAAEIAARSASDALSEREIQKSAERELERGAA